METIKHFAEKYRLRRPRLDEEHNLRVAGKKGFLIENGNGNLKAIFSGTTRTWNNTRKKLEAEGIEITQDGDFEGGFTFSPENEKQSQLVIKALRIPKKRTLSEEHKKIAVQALAKFRSKHSQNGTFRSKTAPLHQKVDKNTTPL